jgi:hypothetical protein
MFVQANPSTKNAHLPEINARNGPVLSRGGVPARCVRFICDFGGNTDLYQLVAQHFRGFVAEIDEHLERARVALEVIAPMTALHLVSAQLAGYSEFPHQRTRDDVVDRIGVPPDYLSDYVRVLEDLLPAVEAIEVRHARYSVGMVGPARFELAAVQCSGFTDRHGTYQQPSRTHQVETKAGIEPAISGFAGQRVTTPLLGRRGPAAASCLSRPRREGKSKQRGKSLPLNAAPGEVDVAVAVSGRAGLDTCFGSRTQAGRAPSPS